MRDLTRQIADAFEALGLQPCQDEFYTGFDSGCCCPLTAMALAEKAILVSDPKLTSGQVDNPVFHWACGKFGQSWVLGFLDGWDWRWPGKSAPLNDEQYREGFETGKHVLRALVMGEQSDAASI